MNFYQFHIGDYRGATAHLSNEEDIAYRRLLDMYYDMEAPIPLDTQWVSRRLRVGIQHVQVALDDFFVKQEDGWHNTRCDTDIARYQASAEKNKENGSKGGRPKKLKEPTDNPVGYQWDTSGMPSGCDWDASGNPLERQPVTNNHEPKNTSFVDSADELGDVDEFSDIPLPTNDAERSLQQYAVLVPPAKPKQVAIACPQDALLDLYEARLPDLAQPRKSLWKDGKNAPALKARWDWVMTACHESGSRKGARMAITQEDGLAWFDRLFSYIAKSDFLMGRQTDFAANLIWLVNKANFEKVISGTYENKDKAA